MFNISHRFLLMTIGTVFIFVLLVCIAELLQVMSLPDAEALAASYWRAPWGSGFFIQHAGYLGFMMMNVWILWVIPLMGLGAMVWAWQVRNDEEVSAYLERIHLVEQALKEARDRVEGADERWYNLNHKLDELFESTGEAWLVVDGAKGIRRWNPAAWNFARRSNPSIDSLEGQVVEKIVSNPALGKVIEEVLRDRRVWTGELHAMNLQQWLLVWVFPLGEEAAIIMRDVSHQHRDQAFLQSSEVLVRQLVEDSLRPVAVLDAEWRYLYYSRKWPEAMGLAASTPLRGMFHKDLVPGFPSDLRILEQRLTSGQTIGRDDERRNLPGREMVLSWNIRAWHDAGGRLGGYIFNVSDMTELVRLRQQVSQAEERENALAYSDALTGLPNRQLFNDRLNMALAQAYRQLGKVALFFLDLDGFKAVNDQLGHDYGDLLLKQVAERLKGCVRSTDTVARLGGDEFTIILAIRDKADAQQVAEKILATIRAPYDLNGKVADKVGTSIGIALYPQDGSQAADLLRKADASMYASKQAGKNTYRFSTVEIVVQG